MGKIDTLIRDAEQLKRQVAFTEKWGVRPEDITRIVLVPAGRDSIHGWIQYHSTVTLKNGDEVYIPTNVRRDLKPDEWREVK